MALLSMAMPFTAKAQDKVEASAGVDLVSGYVWRGQDLGGVSLQPSASIAYKGFSLGAWGSVGIESSDTKEFDLILGYSTGGFSVSVTDYWYNVTGDGVTAKYFQYGAHNAANSHLFEAQIGYDFGPVAVNWYTNFAGDDGVDKDGDRAYSSYISVARTSMEPTDLPYATSAWEYQKTSKSPIPSPSRCLPKQPGIQGLKVPIS